MPYTAHATTTGGRNGHVETSDGLIKAELSVPKDIGGPGKIRRVEPRAAVRRRLFRLFRWRGGVCGQPGEGQASAR